MRNIKGFTLTESLVVCFIIGILAAIAAPSWNAFAADQKLKTVANEISVEERVAQSDARLKKSFAEWLMGRCTTDSSCQRAHQVWDILHADTSEELNWQESAMAGNKGAKTKLRVSLRGWYKPDGTITVVTPSGLVPFASLTRQAKTNIGLSLQPYSALNASSEGLTATTTTK